MNISCTADYAPTQGTFHYKHSNIQICQSKNLLLQTIHQPFIHECVCDCNEQSDWLNSSYLTSQIQLQTLVLGSSLQFTCLIQENIKIERFYLQQLNYMEIIARNRYFFLSPNILHEFYFSRKMEKFINKKARRLLVTITLAFM
jgi:hypothetical protein